MEIIDPKLHMLYSDEALPPQNHQRATSRISSTPPLRGRLLLSQLHESISGSESSSQTARTHRRSALSQVSPDRCKDTEGKGRKLPRVAQLARSACASNAKLTGRVQFLSGG